MEIRPCSVQEKCAISRAAHLEGPHLLTITTWILNVRTLVENELDSQVMICNDLRPFTFRTGPNELKSLQAVLKHEKATAEITSAGSEKRGQLLSKQDYLYIYYVISKSPCNVSH